MEQGLFEQEHTQTMEYWSKCARVTCSLSNSKLMTVSCIFSLISTLSREAPLALVLDVGHTGTAQGGCKGEMPVQNKVVC